MVTRISNKKRSVFNLLCLLSFSACSYSDVEVLDWYPTCEYQVLDTVTESFLVKNRSNEYEANKRQEGILKVVSNFKEEAEKIGADGIIITKKKILFDQKGNPRLQGETHNFMFTAELIKRCEETGTPTEMTPYNERGFNNIHAGTVGIGTPPIILIANTDRSVKHLSPASHTVNLDTGLYGIPLGSKYDHVLATWGQPTTISSLSPDFTMISYGKRHWLTFNKDTLVEVEYGSPWYTRAVMNYVAPSNVFDSLNWEISEGIFQQTDLDFVKTVYQDIRQVNNSLWEIDGAESIMALVFSAYQMVNGGENVLKLDSYKLSLKQVVVPEAIEPTRGMTFAQLLDKDNHTLAEMAIASLVSDAGRKILLMDNHTLVFLSPIGFKRVVYLERAFNEKKYDESRWKFNDIIYQGQTQEKLLEKYPQANVYDDEISIYWNDLDIRLYTESLNGKRVVYEAEIKGNF